METRTNVIHLIAGGAAGTTGAVLTCPLEVVKTRLQSSVSSFVQSNVNACLRLIPQSHPVVTISGGSNDCHVTVNSDSLLDRRKTRSNNSVGLVRILRHIIKTEGVRGLFKGLGPTLVGVAPSRAIYFAAYAKSKECLNTVLTPNSHLVHLCSAAAAGASAVTCTNPVWFVKTRLQLDSKVEKPLTCTACIKQIYQQLGILGFYKGMSASYYGISETMIHLVIYEAIKAKLQAQHTNHDRHKSSTTTTNNTTTTNSNNKSNSNNNNENDSRMDKQREGDHHKFILSDYFKYMLAGACSKTFATCLCYPHEVARTRLREEGSRYKSFFQTLLLVYKEEGRAGVYRGLGTQLIRQIPNTAVVMATYEAVVYMLMPET